MTATTAAIGHSPAQKQTTNLIHGPIQFEHQQPSPLVVLHFLQFALPTSIILRRPVFDKVSSMASPARPGVPPSDTQKDHARKASGFHCLSSIRLMVLAVLCLQNSLYTVLRRYSQGVLKENYSKVGQVSTSFTMLPNCSTHLHLLLSF